MQWLLMCYKISRQFMWTDFGVELLKHRMMEMAYFSGLQNSV